MSKSCKIINITVSFYEKVTYSLLGLNCPK